MYDLCSPQISIHSTCARCPVRHHAVCKALQDRDLRVLSDIMIHQKRKRGQTIWIDEAEARYFGVVTSGVVKLVKTLSDGRHQIVSFLFPSDFLGCIFSSKNENFAEAVTDVELCCFRAREFEQILQCHPPLEHELLRRTLNDLTDAREWMVALGQKTATEKIASFLLRLSRNAELSRHSNVQQTSNFPTFVLSMTRNEMAAYLGLTIETVSRKLTWLRTRCVIRITGNQIFEICDPNALEELSESRNWPET